MIKRVTSRFTSFFAAEPREQQTLGEAVDQGRRRARDWVDVALREGGHVFDRRAVARKVKPGPLPDYKGDDIELTGTLHLVDRSPWGKKDWLPKIEGHAEASCGELAGFLADQRKVIQPLPRFRLCAWLMKKRNFSGREALQVLAEAVHALEAGQKGGERYDAITAQELFKQCRKLYLNGDFGGESQAAAKWLYRLGQLTAELSRGTCSRSMEDDWGNLRPAAPKQL